MEFSPDGQHLITCAKDGTRLWDVATGFREESLSGEGWRFAANGRYLVQQGSGDDAVLEVDTGGRIYVGQRFRAFSTHGRRAVRVIPGSGLEG